MSAEATVFIVDDDKAVRSSLSWLLESVGLKVEAFASAADFLSIYDPARRGCLIADVRMPGMSGLDLQAKLAALRHTIPVIIITGHGDVAMAVRSMKAGAVDFIEKPYSDQMLLDRVQAALRVDSKRHHEESVRAEARRRIEDLTSREREVMDHVVAGKSNKEMAAALDLSQKTVEVHRAQVMRKLKVDSVAELVRLVLESRSVEGV